MSSANVAMLVDVWVGMSAVYTSTYYLILQSYLTNRYSVVCHGEKLSGYIQIKASVPQGSVLGPLLYLVYTADIPTQTSTSMATFADDICCNTEVWEDVFGIEKRARLRVVCAGDDAVEEATAWGGDSAAPQGMLAVVDITILTPVDQSVKVNIVVLTPTKKSVKVHLMTHGSKVLCCTNSSARSGLSSASHELVQLSAGGRAHPRLALPPIFPFSVLFCRSANFRRGERPDERAAGLLQESGSKLTSSV
ncbi:hypothetical protein AAG570_007582 [Ranatra chinensis]|uniref:Reverse transcriptase domain-containing protein n=1 Tax=Ranatra chinensis TaxID=642074 RepID=A0ABD0XU62_9HEMI